MTQPKTVSEIREAYLSFFEERGHKRLPSDSLIPSNDPTLLFTGAGMNQFKDEFLGQGKKDLSRATTSQKCLRVPDLENVGVTPRHHTFFEMLGNFSFGDYFKNETIPWEWEFFTEVLGFDADRMVATVFHDDDEAWKIWHEVVGIPEERIYRLDEDENFWPASAPSKGPNGPCGPCSEIYFDQEPDKDMPPNQGLQALPGRFLEVGNFVFTQFDRQSDGTLPALPQKNIDVGLGLERIAAVIQNAPNNFETDLFAPTLDHLQSISGFTYGEDAQVDIRMRRIADHCRAVFFCIADGAAPGREGRGYIVRKILRRAIRDGIGLGLNDVFLPTLLPAVKATMGAAYPELADQQSTIESMCSAEEERFRDVYQKGITRLEEAINEQSTASEFPGAIAFELHDTYGFPVDITEVMVRDHGMEFDQVGFDEAMAAQKSRARAGSDMSGDVFAESIPGKLSSQGIPSSDFCGHQCLSSTSNVLAILRDGELENAAEANTQADIVLDCSPFYAEGGGQVGDQGSLVGPDGSELFTVKTVRKDGDYIILNGMCHAQFEVGCSINAQVEKETRRATERHHSATHLLHSALKTVLGQHVNQAGSSVDSNRLRFDYTHPSSPSGAELKEIENLVNSQIWKSSDVTVQSCSLDEAKDAGVTALFGEKYGSEVRVVRMATFSAELCGGTHVANTGMIGLFRITSDRSLSAGIRRIEAVAGEAALLMANNDRENLAQLSGILKAPVDSLPARIASLKEQLKEAKQAKKSTGPDANNLAKTLNSNADNGLAWSHLPGIEAETLRSLADQLKKMDLPPISLLVGGDQNSVPYVFLCNAETTHKAGNLAKLFGKQVAGGGGGRPDFAQGQGKNGHNLESAVASFKAELLSIA